MVLFTFMVLAKTRHRAKIDMISHTDDRAEERASNAVSFQCQKPAHNYLLIEETLQVHRSRIHPLDSGVFGPAPLAHDVHASKILSY